MGVVWLLRDKNDFRGSLFRVFWARRICICPTFNVNLVTNIKNCRHKECHKKNKQEDSLQRALHACFLLLLKNKDDVRRKSNFVSKKGKLFAGSTLLEKGRANRKEENPEQDYAHDQKT